MLIARWMLALAASVTLAVAADEMPEAVGPDRVVVGYFPEWAVYARNYHVTNIPAGLLTHVNYAFLKPVYLADEDAARIEVVDSFAAVEKSYPGDTDTLPSRGNFNQLRKLKAAHPHLRTLISVGGATLSGDFSDIAASARARGTFAGSCVAHMTRYGFDGIDIDWEFPVQGGEGSLRHRPEDATNLVLLLRAIREHLDAQEQADGKRYWLTVATSITGNTLTNRYRLPEISREVDWFNLMAYNLIGTWSPLTGHQAPLYRDPRSSGREESVADGVANFLRQGVPAHKLVLGVPFYGRGFQGVAPENHGLFQVHSGLCSEGSWSAGLFTYRDLRDGSQGHACINTNGFADYWDAAARASFLYNHRSGVFITYASPRSLEQKARYARKTGLRGVMCWSLDNDTGDHQLLSALGGASPGDSEQVDTGSSGPPAAAVSSTTNVGAE